MWKDIRNYEGIYQVNELGQVKSLERKVLTVNGYRTIKERLLATKIDKGGYIQVGLHLNGKAKLYSVHRLVAEAFLANPNNFDCVNHKDENKQNNNVDNLEWCNHLYNNIYGNRLSKVSDKNSKPIIQYDLQGNFIKEWKSARDIENELGFYNSNICSACKGRQKSAYGYKWRYKL